MTLPVSTAIHPDDHMYRSGQAWYFPVGESAARLLRIAEATSWLPRIGSVLDLPCGHGRVGRYLPAVFPGADLHFADLDAGGADFCAATFGGTAIHSRPELTEVALPTVDMIWVGSLFTHVDLDRTTRWLRYLCDHLNEDGILVATFHGAWSLRMHTIYPMIEASSWERLVDEYQRTGYGYARYPGWEQDYGISLSSPEALLRIVDAIPGVRISGFLERGWAENHDVLMISRDDRDRAWTPDFRSTRPAPTA